MKVFVHEILVWGGLGHVAIQLVLLQYGALVILGGLGGYVWGVISCRVNAPKRMPGIKKDINIGGQPAK